MALVLSMALDTIFIGVMTEMINEIKNTVWHVSHQSDRLFMLSFMEV